MQRYKKTLVYIHKKMKTSVFYFIAVILVGITFTACEPASNHSNCEMNADPGMCQAAIPRFYYNPTTHQCEQFTWGGCGDFPFETMQACEEACE